MYGKEPDTTKWVCTVSNEVSLFRPYKWNHPFTMRKYFVYVVVEYSRSQSPRYPFSSGTIARWDRYFKSKHQSTQALQVRQAIQVHWYIIMCESKKYIGTYRYTIIPRYTLKYHIWSNDISYSWTIPLEKGNAGSGNENTYSLLVLVSNARWAGVVTWSLLRMNKGNERHLSDLHEMLVTPGREPTEGTILLISGEFQKFKR